MATKNNVTVLKRSSVPGKVPTTAQLAFGELAMNTNDGKLYLKKYDGIGVEQIVDVTNYDPTNVAITGGTINNTSIGATTQSTGNFTTATADLFQSDLTVAAGSSTVGGLAWNDADGTLEFKLKGGNVTLQIGQEQVVRVTNNSGSALTDGQVVFLQGAQGLRPSVGLALASNVTASTNTIGVVTEPIPNNNQGFVTTSGLVNNIDTSAFAEGDVLWLSATTPGAMTNVKPASPNHAVRIGRVVNSNASVGSIFVAVNTGSHLDELHDVAITTPTNDQVLTYESATGIWKNKTFSGGSGATSLDGLSDVTIVSPSANHFLSYDSGTSQWKNSANVAVSGSFSVGGVPFVTSSSNVGIGALVLSANTTGTDNVAIGKDSLKTNTSGGFNTAVGAESLKSSSTIAGSTALGYRALAALTSGNFNTAVGNQALRDSVSGSNNTAVGYLSQSASANGVVCNTSLGYLTLGFASGGSYNTALGNQCLRSNTTGSFNVALGSEALYANSIGDANLAIGTAALRENTEGQLNIGIGNDALNTNTTGSNNIAIGAEAGFAYSPNANTTGSNNIFIGANTIGNGAGSSNQIVIGANAVGRGSGTIVIGSDSTAETYIYGSLFDGAGNPIGGGGGGTAGPGTPGVSFDFGGFTTPSTVSMDFGSFV